MRETRNPIKNTRCIQFDHRMQNVLPSWGYNIRQARNDKSTKKHTNKQTKTKNEIRIIPNEYM